MSDNPSAFPRPGFEQCAGMQDGMTLRDYFAGQALANRSICHGNENDRTLQQWFGNRINIETDEIIARQAYAYADAMLAARTGDA